MSTQPYKEVDMKIREGITFDDVLLEPRKSSVLPAEAKLNTKITKNINLSISEILLKTWQAQCFRFQQV